MSSSQGANEAAPDEEAVPGSDSGVLALELTGGSGRSRTHEASHQAPLPSGGDDDRPSRWDQSQSVCRGVQGSGRTDERERVILSAASRKKGPRDPRIVVASPPLSVVEKRV